MACKDTVRWLYRLDEHFVWHSAFPVGRDWAFQDSGGETRLVIAADGAMTIMKGYAWDGCTPKVCLLDVLLGTPDGAVFAVTGRPKTYYASLLHDALYQFLPDDLPLTRAQCDECFLRLMERDGFALRHVYYAAVRIFGGLSRRITRRVRRTWGGRRIDCSEPGAGSDAVEPRR